MHCLYTKLDNGIHKFVFETADIKSADEYLDYLAQIIPDYTPDQSIPILIDLRPDGFPSVTYSYQTARRFFNQHTNVPKLRVAYLHQTNTLIQLAQNFLELLRIKAERRFFGDAEDEALAWLLDM